ncbi:FAD-dependent monooxygenase [Micromonospora purpureochromogenes]|uniref:FAD-dependent monooxygenase n=1 Tax=Micromonospora purpureochromogenes TaxID=47872 RepID=UPI0033CA7468
MTAVDVLVVGAGPTGLAMAAQLAAFGVRVRVVARAVDRAHESRALAIQPRTLEVLAGSGVTDELLAGGNPAVRLCLHAYGRVRAVPLFDLGLGDTAHPYLLFLSQAETERILGEHLAAAGLAVERGVELVGMNQTGDGVATLRHADGREEPVSARYVVGCDGAHSTVRHLAGIGFEGAAYPQTFVLADLEADGIAGGAAHAFVSGQGPLFLFPLRHPASWRLLVMRPPADAPPPESPVTLDEVQALADTYTGATVRLHDPVWMTNFRLHHRAATRYRAGRVFLAGDAAHIHSPAGAQGMNTGIQDAVNLGWKLAHALRGGADPSLLDTYQAERAPVGRMVLRFTDRAFTAATSTNPVVRFVRGRLAPALIPAVLAPRFVRATAFRTVSQLGIGYRRSPLSTDGPRPPRKGPRAGDRLPDAPVAGANGGTLHRLTAAPRWHLLLCGPPAAWATGETAGLAQRYPGRLTVHRLAESDSTGGAVPAASALRRLGLAPGVSAAYLVRPDGHIGYRSGGTDLTGLTAYLDRWLPS